MFPTRGEPFLEGDFAHCTLADVLQLVGARNWTTRIEFIEDNAVVGHLVVKGAWLLDCESAGQSGPAAFFELWHRRSARFRAGVVTAHSTDAGTQPGTHWKELIFEAARREDEIGRGFADNSPYRGATGDYIELTLATVPTAEAPAGGMEAVATPREAAPEPAGEPAALGELLRAGMAAYLAGRLPAALAIFEKGLATAPDDPRIVLMLQRIRGKLAPAK